MICGFQATRAGQPRYRCTDQVEQESGLPKQQNPELGDALGIGRFRIDFRDTVAWLNPTSVPSEEHPVPRPKCTKVGIWSQAQAC